MSKTKTKTAKAVRCGACGRGVFQDTDVKGQCFPHRDEPSVTLTTTVIVPVCTACGEMLTSGADAAALDAALEPVYQARRAAMTAEFVQRLVSAGWY